MVNALAVDQSKQQRKLNEERPGLVTVFEEEFRIPNSLNTGELCRCEHTGEEIDITDLNSAAVKSACKVMEDKADGPVDNSRQIISECSGKPDLDSLVLVKQNHSLVTKADFSSVKQPVLLGVDRLSVGIMKEI
jgi:hypothetical protein